MNNLTKANEYNSKIEQSIELFIVIVQKPHCRLKLQLCLEAKNIKLINLRYETSVKLFVVFLYKIKKN